ncbi:endonuclease G, mitochondrial [Trichonephila inaurata madagascariensis]|uniref:Endonuclease G, mitochondrial n=1 Tax=Trichonephila inaurata madagascariensis TaxID=2747483 RepID=A0A8X7BVI2_9ARAC|nr:endonuclease G, mitochondrial [Trichonephila inaurata madagascariensis]
MTGNLKKFLPYTAGAVGLVAGMLYAQFNYKKKISAILPSCDEYLGFHINPDIGNKFGILPATTFKTMEGYSLLYNHKTKTADWAFECITKESVSPNTGIEKKKRKVIPDDTVPSYFQSSAEDFRNTGYSKGHLVPAANQQLTSNLYKETFILTNIVPMYDKFNSGIWKTLEDYIRKLAMEGKTVGVYCGSLYLPSKDSDNFVRYDLIGPHKIAVPTHFFKSAAWEVEDGKYDMIAYIFPHENKKIKNLKLFEVDREKICKDSGLRLFYGIKDTEIRYLNGKLMKNQEPSETSPRQRSGGIN